MTFKLSQGDLMVRRKLFTPLGVFLFDPDLDRVTCDGLDAGKCIVQIPRSKPTGLCFGCEGRAVRQMRGESE